MINLGGCLCDKLIPSLLSRRYLTGVHLRGDLQQVGHMVEQKIKCRPIRSREIAEIRMQDELFADKILTS